METSYKPKLSDMLSLFSESQTIAMAKAGRELSAQGKQVVNLSFGEPDFDTPNYIKDAAIEAIHKGYTKYTPVAGIPALKEAIAKKFERENNLHYEANQIVVSTGAKNSIMNSILALLNPGDEVIIPTPYWVSYSDMVKLAGGKPIFVEADHHQDFKINANQLTKAITSKTKLFMFSSPCNPTGSIYSRKELAALVSVFEKNEHVFIISDEIYEHINYKSKHESMASFPSIYNRVITVNGLSKAYAMTGWRIGYIGAHPDIAAACEKIQGQFTSGTNSIAQHAAVTALGADLTETYKMRDTFLERRDLVLKRLSTIQGLEVNVPEGAFYVFPKVSSYFGKSFEAYKINNASDLAMYILNTVYVATVDGGAFGAPNYLRISYAASTNDLEKAFERIELALSKLK